MEGRLLRERLCRKFCRYYKPWKDEGLACMGYLVIERLSEGGREMSFPSAAERPGTSAERLLAGLICSRCPFYEDGCDFVKGVPDSWPCGGFIVLGHMSEKGSVSADEIQRVVEFMK
ncbi:MAG: hypothetical protein P8013_00540 [Candidatus Sulfobium sp.]